MKGIIFDFAGVILKEGSVIKHQLMPIIGNVSEYDIMLERYNKLKIGKIEHDDFWMNIDNSTIHEKAFLESFELNHGMEAISDLRARYKLGLLSNFVSVWAWKLIRRFNLGAYFDEIAISGDVGMKKPDKEFYEYMFQKMKLPAEECYVVDDQKRNLKPAKKLGCTTIFFRTDRDEWFNKEIDFEADFTVDSLWHIKDIVR